MTTQPVLSDDMRPDTAATARAYLEAREELRELGRQTRALNAQQKEREGVLQAFLEDAGEPITLPGFDEEIYLGTRTRRKMAPTGETVEYSKVKVRKVGEEAE